MKDGDAVKYLNGLANSTNSNRTDNVPGQLLKRVLAYLNGRKLWEKLAEMNKEEMACLSNLKRPH